MSKLYLMQHGKNLPIEEDPEEGLSQEGKDGVYTSIKVIKALSLSFDLVVMSPKKRSIETAQIIANSLNISQDQMIQTPTIKALSPAEDAIAFLKEKIKGTTLVVGHLPSLLQISSYLLSEEMIKLSFENAGITYIHIENWIREGGSLVWHLPVSLLEKLVLK